jgi:hypothetical protein
MRLKIWALGLLIALPLTAQEPTKPTPRQSYDRAEALFADGHLFTAPELAALAELRTRVIDTGDQSLVADLDLLRLGATTEALFREAGERGVKTLAEDANLWVEQGDAQSGQGFWRGVRDLGIATFTLSTMATLLLATVNDRNEALIRNSFYNSNSWREKEQFSTQLRWAILGTSTTMFFSLFPLLWGEARQ